MTSDLEWARTYLKQAGEESKQRTVNANLYWSLNAILRHLEAQQTPEVRESETDWPKEAQRIREMVRGEVRESETPSSPVTSSSSQGIAPMVGDPSGSSTSSATYSLVRTDHRGCQVLALTSLAPNSLETVGDVLRYLQALPWTQPAHSTLGSPWQYGQTPSIPLAGEEDGRFAGGSDSSSPVEEPLPANGHAGRCYGSGEDRCAYAVGGGQPCSSYSSCIGRPSPSKHALGEEA